MAKAFPLLTVSVEGTVAQNIPLMLHVRTAELQEFAQHVHDSNRVAELHAMRIAAKRLRYTLEIFQPYIDPPQLQEMALKQLAATKKIQEMIGEIHDRDVRVPLIHNYLTKHEHKNPELQAGLTRLISEESHDRDKIYAEFTIYWDQIKSEYISGMMLLISGIATWVYSNEESLRYQNNTPQLAMEKRRASKVAGGKN